MNTHQLLRYSSVYIVLGCTLLLTACNNDELNPTNNGPIAAQITANIENSATSRAAGTAWETGDGIGITTSNNGTKNYTNIKYTAGSTTGNFTGAPIYFQDSQTTVTFTAYYPFNGTEGTAPGILENNTKIDNQKTDGPQSVQSKIDYLFASATGSNGNPKVAFNFAHKMSQVTLTFQNGKDTDISSLTAYSIEGLKMEGTFNTATGEAKAKDGSSAETLAVDVNSAASGTTLPSLILYPQAATDVTLKITLNGQPYNCKLVFKESQLASGNNYLFTITVNKNEMEVQSSSIASWTPQTGSGSASMG
jgi:hypothetical protein